MFITAPGLVQHLHPSQVAPRQAHWPAVTLAVEVPWFLLVHRVAWRGGVRSQTTLVGRDTTLLALLGCIPAPDVLGIARLQRCAGAGPGWALQGVSALWASAPGEAAGEAAVGLAIIIVVFRGKIATNVDQINLLKW